MIGLPPSCSGASQVALPLSPTVVIATFETIPGATMTTAGPAVRSKGPIPAAFIAATRTKYLCPPTALKEALRAGLLVLAIATVHVTPPSIED